MYESLAIQGSTLKKIEREVHIAEEDYLENLTSLNDALQKEHASASSSDLRLIDAPTLPTLPEQSKRLMLVAAGGLLGGAFPFVLAIAMELLSGGLTSFEEAERRSGLSVVGGVARWSTVRKVLRKRYRKSLDLMTADLLWQGIRSKTGKASARHGPQLLTVTSLQPGAGKSHVTELLAQRLAERGFRVAVIADRPGGLSPMPSLDVYIASVLAADPQAHPCALCGLRQNEWDAYQIVLWELPAIATGRLPVDLVRQSDEVLLIHPPSKGWTKGHESSTTLLTEAFGRKPLLVLNGMAADVLLNLWGASWGELRRWAQGAPAIQVHPRRVAAVPPATQDPVAVEAPAPVDEPQALPGRTADANSWATALAQHAAVPSAQPQPLQAQGSLLSEAPVQAERPLAPPPPTSSSSSPSSSSSWEANLLGS